ncbi:MAG: type II secretion system secretin GspD [Archangiaceae bacterium]|nr:type II secretion system secretin GspD [Archangiaceae bacterium]
MKMTRSALISSCLLSAVALAQPARLERPRPPGGVGLQRDPPPAPPAAGDKTIVPGAEGAAAPDKKKPNCEELRRSAKYNVYFDKVEIEKLVQTVSDATCKTFILPENVRGKISIIGPEAGKVAVGADEFYAAFLAALDANSLSLYPHGKFLKIVDKQRAKQFPIPTVLDPAEAYSTNEQMVTRMFKVKYVEIEQLRGVLQQLVTPSGDTIPFQPDTIIVNDLGSNMKRLERIVEQLDSRSASDEIRIIQIQYATAQEIADKVQKLFESKAQKPGQRPGGNIASLPPQPPQPGGNGVPGGQPAGNAPGTSEGGGPATLSQLIPDERTNKLIVIASPAAFDRIQALIAAIDIPGPTGDKINVYALENANAEDLASTLQTLAQGTANRPKVAPGQPPPPKPAGVGAAAELFQGEVKISADKSTNSLVVIASSSDYRSLVKIIEKLDISRKQVFVEAVIMEVNLDRSSELGVNLHGGLPLKTDQGTLPLLFGTKYSSSGLPPSLSLANLANFGGFLAGLQGPMIPGLEIGGVQIPAWGVVINALQSSSDVNVLSTPHILATDNEDAEITVGQNVPFQSGFAPSSLGGLASSIPGASSAIPGLGTSLLGGLGSAFAPIQRQNVELKLTIKPQINEGDFVRMTINEQTEEIASRDPVLGPTTAKRTAKTTIIARDQETVVIGGIMQERAIEGVKKVPILGDIPLLGNLFRSQTHQKIKTNLLLFLTPYIIKDSSDFRRIFERKMKERQQFVEQFYGAVSGYDVAIDFSRKPGPLARMTQAVNHELTKFENGGPGQPGERLFQPGSKGDAPTPRGSETPRGDAPRGDATASPGGKAPDAKPVVAPGNPAPAPNQPPPQNQPVQSPERLEVQ